MQRSAAACPAERTAWPSAWARRTSPAGKDQHPTINPWGRKQKSRPLDELNKNQLWRHLLSAHIYCPHDCRTKLGQRVMILPVPSDWTFHPFSPSCPPSHIEALFAPATRAPYTNPDWAPLVSPMICTSRIPVPSLRFPNLQEFLTIPKTPSESMNICLLSFDLISWISYVHARLN